jgi:hypothetical protein
MIPVVSGVPQGTTLAPTLFIAFINPLLEAFKLKFPHLLLLAFADDLVLLAPSRSSKEIDVHLQPAIDYISDYVASLGLEFNTEKTQASIFQLAGKITYPVITLNGKPIVYSNDVKYLGVQLSHDMKFSDHCHNVASSARRMVGAFRRKFGKYSPTVLKTVYTQCVLPRLDYGCCAWSPAPTQITSIKDLEKAQKFAVRSILNDWTSDYKTQLDQLSWTSLVKRRSSLKLVQFFKYYHGYADYPNRTFMHADMSERRFSRRREIQPHALEIRPHRTDAYKQSFEFSVINDWNKIPNDIILESLDRFKNYLTDSNL